MFIPNDHDMWNLIGMKCIRDEIRKKNKGSTEDSSTPSFKDFLLTLFGILIVLGIAVTISWIGAIILDN